MGLRFFRRDKYCLQEEDFFLSLEGKYIETAKKSIFFQWNGIYVFP